MTVQYYPTTHTYRTPDGTVIAAELVDNIQCLAEVLYIALIREKQRAALITDVAVQPAVAE